MKNIKTLIPTHLSIRIMLLCLLFAVTAYAISEDNSAAEEKPAVQTASINFENNYNAIELIQKYRNDSTGAYIRESLLREQIASSDSVHRISIRRQSRKLKTKDSLKLVSLLQEIDSVKSLATPAHVILNNDTVMTLYAPTGALTPDERSRLYSERLLQTAKKTVRTFPASARDTLTIVDNGISTDIICGKTVLASVTDMDAYWMNTDRNALASVKKEKLHNSLIVYEKTLGLMSFLKMIGLSLLAVALLIVLLKLVNYLFRKVIDKKIIDVSGKWLKTVQFNNIELLTSEKLVSVTLFISKILRYSVYLLLFYTALPIIFAIFPATRHLAAVLLSWITSPLISMGESLIAYMPKLLRIIIIVLIMRYTLKFLRYITNEVEAGRLTIPRFYPDWAKATYNLLKIFICSFTIVLIFPLLPESESAVFKGVSVFIGVLFSIGSSSVIANMVAGLVITYMRSFKIGDRIRVGEVFGDVIEKTLFVVRVQTVKKEIITIPNSAILSSNIVNYSITAHEHGVILYQSFEIGYNAAWEKVSKFLIEAALKTKHVLENPRPFVLTQTLNNYTVSYQINVYTKRPELQASICSELNQNILDTFQQNGIDLVNPTYQAIRNGEESTIPQEYNQAREPEQV